MGRKLLVVVVVLVQDFLEGNPLVQTLVSESKLIELVVD